MYPIIWHFGRLSIYTHGVMIALGAIAGGVILYLIARKQNYRTDFLFDIIVYSLFGGIIGAHILYVILYHNQFESFKEILFIWNGGLVSYGGIIGGFLVAWLFLYLKKENVLRWFDLGIIGLMIGWAFGRIGCLLNGDCVGIISAAKIAIWGRIPTQLFESIWVAVVALICYLGLKIKNERQLPDGIIFLAGIGLYALGRFVIDFWREETLFIWFMKASQFGSLVLLILTIIAIIILIKKEKRSNGGY